MSIRTRLLISFIGIALLIVVLFSVLTYRTAQETAARQDAATLLRTLEEIASYLAPRLLQPDYDPAQLQDLRFPYLQHARLVWVHNSEGESISLGNLQRDKFPAKARLLQALASSHLPRSGQLEANRQAYTWASVFIPGSSWRLTVVHPAQLADFVNLGGLGIRMLVMAAVLICIAIWGALIIASMLSKHLRQQNARLVHQALHDELTDLPNRNLLYDRLDQALHHAHRNHCPLALFLMDLDRFKDVNDTLGHHFGDYLLQQVGKRVLATLRETDTVARLGGDEFAILLPATDCQAALMCADKLLAALDTPIPVSGMSLAIKTSIGIALYPQHGLDTETLLQHADVAMYQAKRSNSGYRLYEHEQDPHSVRRLSLIAELRDAIVNNQLFLHYQPKVNLKQQRSIGVEALVRWRHPQLGELTPEEFVPLAEQNGLIGPLTDWVLNEAIQQCQDWRARGINLRIAINLSAHSLHNLQLPDQIATRLAQATLSPNQLDIELTESAMMSDVARANDIFERLAKMGIGLAIDDFGTGMSSLSYLKRLPVNELKIDKSFVTDMVIDENNAVIVRSIIDLAHNIGREVVAEGVQDLDTLQLLEILGCDTAQGYYISRPLNAAELEVWLHDSQWGLRAQDTKFESLPGHHSQRRGS